MDQNQCNIEGETIATAKNIEGLYELEVFPEQVNIAKVEKSQMLWYKRLGHSNHFKNKFEDTPESIKITASFPLSGEDEDSVETRSESTLKHPEPRAEDPIEEENGDVREESESGSENSECIEEETSVEESEDAS
ncbi:hypothetical protein JTB14_021789 [Gonioctena quinquepunctata]|nr:hypothetical protein JTB14_021789 [Gonioctena quinquepunctata]